MSYDATGFLDLEGEGTPDLFLVSSIFLLIVLIADLGFTGFRNDNLGLIVTAFLFVITLISYLSLSERIILSEGHIFDGALGFTLGVLALNLGNIIGGLELSILSSATTSYLSGILGSGSQFVIPIVNIIFAPLGETFLIFGLTAGIYQLVKQTDLVDAPAWKLTLIIGFIPSIVFGSLHGARSIQFLLFAFSINILWTAIIVYSDYGKIPSKLVPGTLGLVAGLHVGFNSSSFGGIFKFFSLMIEALPSVYARSASAILLFFVLMAGAAVFRVYQVVSEEGFGVI